MKTLPVLLILSFTLHLAVSAKPQKYAVLVAASRSWLFYRHQATVMHAYQTLLANGFSKDNIITMTYDDLAQNPKNTEKGVVRNHPFGENLYPITKKDYTGSKVNADTFLAILAGDSATAKGPVLKSGPKDTVFIYFVGLGATQYLTFPTGPGITAQKFTAAIKKLRSDKKAKKVLVFLETSFSASMVTGLLPRKGNIFVQTATHHHELPWAVYCDKEKRVCYGSLYGCGWTQRSDRLRQMRYGAKASIWDFYNYVRTVTTFTHPNMYGHLEMGKEKISQFLDYKLVPRKQPAAKSSLLESLALNALNDANDQIIEQEMDDKFDSKFDKQLDGLYDYLGFAKGDEFGSKAINHTFSGVLNSLDATLMAAAPESHSARNEMTTNRNFVSETIKKIFAEIKTNKTNERADTLMQKSFVLDPLSEKQADVYDGAIKAFHKTCFDINENTYAQAEMGKLAVLAAENITLEEQVTAMNSVCSDHHRTARSIH